MGNTSGRNPKACSSSASRRQFLQTASLAFVSVPVSSRVRAAAATAGGTQLWQFDTSGVIDSSPTVVNGTVFVGDQDHGVHAVDANTGETDWQFSTDGFVFRSSPNVVDGTVFIGDSISNDNSSGGILYALAADTGATLWQFTEPSDWIGSSPTVVDGTVFVGSFDGTLYALDAGTGETDWEFQTGDWVQSSPTVVDGTVYVGSRNATLYALDAGTGETDWQFTTGHSVLSSPTVADGTVYVGSWDNSVSAIDATTGTQNWQFSTDDVVFSSPTVADGSVYVGSDDGTLYAIHATTGTKEWVFSTGDLVRSSPTVVDGTVFVGSNDGTIYALETATGESVWEFDTGGPVKSSPTVVGGTLYVGSNDRTLYAIDAGVTGASQDSRVRLGTLGHHYEWAGTEPGPVSIDVRLSPTERAAKPGSSRSLELRVTNAASGIATYAMLINVGDSQVAEITDYSLTHNPESPSVSLADDGSTLEFNVDMGENAHSPGDVVLAELTVDAIAEGTTSLSLSGVEVTDTQNEQYEIEATNGAEMTVSVDPPPVVGDSSPTDPDDDGRYEDINGDETLDIFDVQALFDNLDSDAVQAYPDAFNFSGDENPDEIDIFDVQALFDELNE